MLTTLGSCAAQCLKLNIIAKADCFRLPVSDGWDLLGSWQREVQCCEGAVTPLSLQKKKKKDIKIVNIWQTFSLSWRELDEKIDTDHECRE